MQDLVSTIADLVKPGTTTYLKLRDGDEEKIIACKVIDCNAGDGEPNSTPMVFETSHFTDSMAASLAPGTGVISFLLVSGILYSLPASVVDCTAGETLQIRLLLPNQCRGRSLRQNQRYSTLGTYQLSSSDGVQQLNQDTPVPINISLGGIGLRVHDFAIEPGSEITFSLKVIIDQNGQPHPDAPVLLLKGTAIARYLMVLDADKTAYCGFRFLDLDADMLGTLAFWIRSHEALLQAQ